MEKKILVDVLKIVNKMQVKEAIKKRRSIRKYLDKEISNEVVNELIEAARLAPSAYNAQPWRFRIVKDKEMIKRFKEEEVFKHEFVYTAGLIIVCCGDKSLYPERAREDFDLKDLVYGDLGICSQNLVLRAVELGLGSCYVGIVDRVKLRRILNIPENYIIPYVLVIGYPDEEPEAKERRSREEIVF